MREHVREADERGVALDVVGVVALDRRRDGPREVPAAGEHAAGQRVVDAQLAALVVQALLGRARRAVDLLRVARVGVHQDELADVVQQRGDQQAVAMRVAGLGGQAVRGALDGDGVQAEALRGGVPRLAALEELERLGAGGERLHGLGRDDLDGGDDRLDLAALGRSRPLARRRTAITSATSDSIAVTTSAVDGRSSAISESRRLRDSASAGKRSSASKAAVRRLP